MPNHLVVRHDLRAIGNDLDELGPGEVLRNGGFEVCGVPQWRSNVDRSIASERAWGRNSNMPPPSLFTATIRSGTPRAAASLSAVASWRTARSPMRRVT